MRNGLTEERRIYCWLAVVALLWNVVIICAAAADTETAPWVDTHIGEIDPQEAYGGAEDEITAREASELLLQLTNASRQRAGLAALELMELAAQVAQAHAGEMAQHQLSSHYSQDGYTCELRFNLAGGTDHIQENTTYYEIKQVVFLTPQLVKRMHGHWMSSDAHRRNILDPQHTHLGAGFAVVRDEDVTYVAGVAEFVNDYGEYTPLPQTARRGDVFKLQGRIDRERAALRYIGVGVGELPVPSAAGPTQPAHAGYKFPKVVLVLLPRRIPSTPLPGIEFVRHSVDYEMLSGEFATLVELDAEWPPGAYYVTVWVDRQGAAGWENAAESNEPVCVMTQVILVE